MGDAMRDPMIELTATVPTSPDVVLDRVIAAVGGHGRLEVDRGRRFVAVQGGWWYRGEYEVDQAAGGARLTHRVRNVASRGRWAAPLANRLFIGFRAQTERNFAGFVASLE
jgi:hypothetical protein